MSACGRLGLLLGLAVLWGCDPAPTAPPLASPAPFRLAGTISISRSLAERARDAGAVYVVVRDAATREVIAARKEARPRFPLPFRLSPEDLIPDAATSEGPLNVTVRVSLSGRAMPARGDLEGRTAAVPAGSQEVSVRVDTVLE